MRQSSPINQCLLVVPNRWELSIDVDFCVVIEEFLFKYLGLKFIKLSQYQNNVISDRFHQTVLGFNVNRGLSFAIAVFTVLLKKLLDNLNSHLVYLNWSLHVWLNGAWSERSWLCGNTWTCKVLSFSKQIFSFPYCNSTIHISNSHLAEMQYQLRSW